MNRLIISLFFSILVLLNTGQPLWGRQSSEVLTNASDVLSLSAEQASLGIKISIKGVVTAAEPNWGGRFFVQDSSGGVFVENISNEQPSPGDVITVSGVSYPGGYAPIISQPRWKKIGTAQLPAPKSVAIEQLMSGAEDSQRIEISGIVRDAQITTNGQLGVELASGGYRVSVYEPIPPGIAPQTLVGAKIQVKGTAATDYNAPLRHLITVDVYVPFLADCIVEKNATPDPFKEPLTPVNSIDQYHAGRSPADRVHVKGVVTCQRRGEDVFIRDDTGGLQIKSGQTLFLSPGDVVEAVGFPGVENFLPVLEDAVFKTTGETQTNTPPKIVPIEELLEGLHHADLITLKGKLLDRLTREDQSSADDPDVVKTTLVLQASNLLFTAETETVKADSLLAIPIGSIIEVSGICFLQSEQDGKIKSFQILLPTSNSVHIITKPSWLTPQHLSIILGMTFIVIIVATSWIVMISRKNSTLRYLIHERELDQKELQTAHDTLEWRVKERTEQLKFQITARKEAEVQSKAILTERTRLAKELHDTLEQTLTGVSLQLNTVGKLFENDQQTAKYHLGLVRNMVRMSRVDLRRSIWDLRSRELEEFDLSRALLISGNQIADSAGIRVEVETEGNVRPLPEVVEENLLRIGQEAVANAVKHSNANWVRIKLEFNADNVILEINDNGKGFTPEMCAGPKDGHFGLLGMSERAKRLGGHILIASTPGAGTTIRVGLSIEQTQTPKLASEQTDYEKSITHPDSDR